MNMKFGVWITEVSEYLREDELLQSVMFALATLFSFLQTKHVNLINVKTS